MNRVRSLSAAWILLVCFGAASPAHADGLTPPTPGVTYEYVITIPSFDGIAPGAMFTLDWIGAPLNPNGIGSGANAVLTGYPQDGFDVFSIAAWTATIANAPTTGDPLDSEIFLQFSNIDGKLLPFSFIEPDSFWATTGTTSFTPSGQEVTGLIEWSNFPDGAGLVWDTTAEGAYYYDAPTPCTTCTITVSAAVPEPAGVVELGTILLISGVVAIVAKKRKLAARAGA